MGEQFLYEYHHRPGRRWDDDTLGRYVREFRDVASTCFDELPEYQCLSGSREELADDVITVARTTSGKMVGFSSAVLLPVERVGTVLHLGLTCVRSDARGASLSHKLTSKLVTRYLVTRSPVSKLWMTSVACVLSSLGNIALNFDDVYPSPLREGPPSETHLRIARAFDAHHRARAFVRPDATFDAENFVFRGSGRDTPFQKDETDARYYHRNAPLNDYYRNLMRFEDGDEILQVCSGSVLSALRYFGKSRERALARLRTAPITAAARS
jgi:hypothetical protein